MRYCNLLVFSTLAVFAHALLSRKTACYSKALFGSQIELFLYF